MTPITLLDRCSGCEGFLPRQVDACPNCGKACRARGLASRLRLSMLGGAIGGGAIAFTLMACYGRPPCPDTEPECYGPRPKPVTPLADDAASKPTGNDMPFAVPPDASKK